MKRQFTNIIDFIVFYNQLDCDSSVLINQKYKLATIKDNKLYRWNSKGNDVLEVKSIKVIDIEYTVIDKKSFEYRFQDMENRIGVHAISI